MIQTRTIGSFTEIYVGGGNFMTESEPTYFHTFHTRKMLTQGESTDDYMEVTPQQRAALEAHDATYEKPDASFIVMWNLACGIYGCYNEATGYFELNGLTDITYQQALSIYGAGAISSPNGSEFYQSKKIRTNLPLTVSYNTSRVNLERVVYINDTIEVLTVANKVNSWKVPLADSSYFYIFRNARKLHTIVGGGA